jgi:hypothetical protein
MRKKNTLFCKSLSQKWFCGRMIHSVLKKKFQKSRYLKMDPSNIYRLPLLLLLLPILLLLQLPIFKSVDAFNGISTSTGFILQNFNRHTTFSVTSILIRNVCQLSSVDISASTFVLLQLRSSRIANLVKHFSQRKNYGIVMSVIQMKDRISMVWPFLQISLRTLRQN